MLLLRLLPLVDWHILYFVSQMERLDQFLG